MQLRNVVVIALIKLQKLIYKKTKKKNEKTDMLWNKDVEDKEVAYRNGRKKKKVKMMLKNGEASRLRTN